MATDISQPGQSRLNRQAEAACYWGFLLFAFGTLAHVLGGLGLVILNAAGISWPFWLNFVIVPTLPIAGLAVVVVGWLVYHATES